MVRKAILYLFMTGILSVITLPLVNGLQDARKDLRTSCYKGPHVVISSGRAKGQCHDCSSRYKCPKGSGLSIECAGQNVSGDINIHCVACVAGVNFSSTYDHSQCEPCPKICDGQNVTGKCETDGDHRKCVNCSKGCYFNQTDPTSTTVESEKGWSVSLIVGVTCGVVMVVVFAASYCCSVVKNLRTFRQQKSHYPCCLGELLEVFCWCSFIHCEFAHDLSGENEMVFIECQKEKLAVGKLNMETFRKLANRIPLRSVLDNGFDTLAGRMGYNVEEADEFKLGDNPVKTILFKWGQTRGNSVVKLKQLFQEMHNDDLVQLLKEELNNVLCQCTKCQDCPA